MCGLTDGLHHVIMIQGPDKGESGGQCPGEALFGGAALLVKRRNSKWSFMVFATTWWS